LDATHVYPSIPARILLPIDFSSSSKVSLGIAADLASHFRAELYLVHVIPFFPIATYPDMGSGVAFLPDLVSEGKFAQESKTFAEHHLAKCQASLLSRGVKSRSSVEVGNDVVGSIMEVVEREHIDMVVISTHGISGWHPLLFGSIAEKIVKLVECPLLLLRSAKPEPGEKAPTSGASEWW